MSSKADQIKFLASKANLAQSDISRVLDALDELVAAALKRDGEIKINGLVKISVTKTKATDSRKQYNPLVKKEITIKAKPAGKKVSVKALTKLKGYCPK